MRKIVLDTETTGMPAYEGHRIIEIGCVELNDREVTTNYYHQYINPEREVDEGAFNVHGISDEFLSDKPVMGSVIDEFIDFIRGAELIIHNATFDIGFINHELELTGRDFKVEDICTVVDTLQMARKKFPGSRASLDALSKRFGINNFNRELHGALLDSEILAQVYLAMTGGQSGISFSSKEELEKASKNKETINKVEIHKVEIKAEELELHNNFFKEV